MAFTDKQEEFILELYEITKDDLGRPNQTKASHLFFEKYNECIHPKTIRYKWNKSGFKRQKRGGMRHGFNEEAFRIFYDKYGGDITSMLKKVDFKKRTLIGLCKRYDLEPKNIPRDNKKSSLTVYPKTNYRLNIEKNC